MNWRSSRSWHAANRDIQDDKASPGSGRGATRRRPGEFTLRAARRHQPAGLPGHRPPASYARLPHPANLRGRPAPSDHGRQRWPVPRFGSTYIDAQPGRRTHQQDPRQGAHSSAGDSPLRDAVTRGNDDVPLQGRHRHQPRARTLPTQGTETKVAWSALNCMTNVGTPVSQNISCKCFGLAFYVHHRNCAPMPVAFARPHAPKFLFFAQGPSPPSCLS